MPAGITTEGYPTEEFKRMDLRFIKRAGPPPRFVLQQKWVTCELRGTALHPVSFEWRDVPLVEE